MSSSLNAAIRSHFPSLSITEGDRAPIFFDNPGGTQVAREVIDAVNDYYLHHNANHGGAFATSVRSDAILHAAHAAMADFLGAASPDEIVFGPNMTTLTFNVSRAIGRLLKPGDEIVVTRLDHDANIAPWRFLAEERGCLVRWLDFDPEDCTLDLAHLDNLLGPRTRLLAIGYASNAVGTINPVAEIARRAHAAGALCFVDAVQYAPHRRIDVGALGCDFLVVSAYKFFGPHLGILYGRHEVFDRLRAYKVRPAPESPPGKFETGTQQHENIVGTLGALEYLASLAAGGQGLRAGLDEAMRRVESYERRLTDYLIDSLQTIPGLRLYGITEPGQREARLPTVSFTLEGHYPRVVAEHLATDGINAWDGNFYALAVTERLELEGKGGLIRVGLVHYNTEAEVDRLMASLRTLA